MALPMVEVIGKKVILLSGYQRFPRIGPEKPRSIKIEAIRKLRQSAFENPDAVAFGYTEGRWIPSA